MRVALVDNSCYSGNSLKLAVKNTCIVTGAGAETFSLSSFGDSISSGLRHGSTLEDVFLDARDKLPFNPQISSNPGAVLTKALSRYLDGVTPDVLGKQVRNTNISDAAVDPSFSELRSDLTGLPIALNEHQEALTKFFSAVNEYRSALRTARDMQTRLDQYGSRQLIVNGGVYQWTSLLNVAATIQAMEKIIATCKPGDIICANAKNSLKNLTEYSDLRTQLLKTDSNFTEYVRLNDDFEKYIKEPKTSGAYRHFGSHWHSTDGENQGPLFKVALKAMEAEHAIYKALYFDLRRTMAQKSDPCRDFKL